MLEADFAEAVTPHETTFIYIAVDANNTPFTGILPHCDIPSICQYRLFLRVHGNHQFVVIDLSKQMSVVEVSERIQQGEEQGQRGQELRYGPEDTRSAFSGDGQVSDPAHQADTGS